MMYSCVWALHTPVELFTRFTSIMHIHKKMIFFIHPLPSSADFHLSWATALVMHGVEQAITALNFPFLSINKMSTGEWPSSSRGGARSTAECGADANNRVERVLPTCVLPPPPPRCRQCPGAGPLLSPVLCAHVLPPASGDFTKPFQGERQGVLSFSLTPARPREAGTFRFSFNAFPPLLDTESKLKS